MADFCKEEARIAQLAKFLAAAERRHDHDEAANISTEWFTERNNYERKKCAALARTLAGNLKLQVDQYDLMKLYFLGYIQVDVNISGVLGPVRKVNLRQLEK